MTLELKGPWTIGIAYDFHTLDGIHLDVDEASPYPWGSFRTEMGQLVYDLKYRGNRSTLPRIVELLKEIEGLEEMDHIVPAPSSNYDRTFQPVAEIAKALGAQRNVPVIEELLFKEGERPEIKNIDSFKERGNLLRESIRLNVGHEVAGNKVLLVDDLYRSGATLAVATEMLFESAKAKEVYVLAMTKTRSRR